MKKNMKFKVITISILLFAAHLISSCANTNKVEAPSYISNSTVASNIDTYLSRMVPLGFNGAVVVAEGNSIILNKGYGLADRSQDIPNTANTVFSLGSIVKTFTSVSILRLYQENELKLSDNLGKYFSNVPADKSMITIKQMLSHTSGLPPQVGTDYENITKADLINSAFDQPLAFTPGSGYQYSNVAYSLLALIIEDITGLGYEEYIYTNIFKPAGMTQTGYTIPTWEQDDIAHNYTGMEDNGTFSERTYYPNWNLIGNGGILSTTTDMFRFYQYLKSDEFINAETKELMFTPVWDTDALGIVALRGGEFVQHNGGGWDGNSALFRWYIQADKMFMIFTNSGFNNKPGFVHFEDPLDGFLIGEEKVVMPPEISNSKDLDFPEIEGSYRFKSNDAAFLSINKDYPFFRLSSNTQETINMFEFPEKEISSFTDWNQKIKIATLELIQDRRSYSYPTLFSGGHDFSAELLSEIENEGFSNNAVVDVLTFPTGREGFYNTKILIRESEKHSAGLAISLITDLNAFGGAGYDFEEISGYSVVLIPQSQNTWISYDFNSGKSSELTLEYLDDGSLEKIKTGDIAITLIKNRK